MHIEVLYNYTINVTVHCKLSIIQKVIILIFGGMNIMFLWLSHIYVPPQSWNWTLSWSSISNCISHSGIPYSHPILFLAWSVLNINQGHHRFWGAEGFVGGGSSPGCHSNLLCFLHLSCKLGTVVPMCISLQLIYCSVWVIP